MATKDEIIKHLETVIDPELGIDIYTLGLVYEIDVKSDDRVHILMTYTTPMCPAGPIIQADIRSTLEPLGFEHIEIEVTFDPPWDPPEALRIMMGV